MRQHLLLGSILVSIGCGGASGTASGGAPTSGETTFPMPGASLPANALGGAGMQSGHAGHTGTAATASATTQAPSGPAAQGGMPATAMTPPQAGSVAPNMTNTAGAGAPVVAATPTAGSGTPASTAKSLADCPAPPPEAGQAAIAALNAVNTLRLAAGAPCAALNMQIVQAASAHCMYFQMNSSNSMCTANPHMEVMGCDGFTGASPIDRMRAAGFMGFGGGEVMAFVNSPERSVQTWVDSVWHRLPILDPATNLLGYGSTGSPGNCDTIDFGPGNRVPADTLLVYPYDGQTDVTTTFDGSREGPMPPAPPTGWPSSNPITLYAQKPMITEHVLTVDGSGEPIEHVWLDANSSLLSASDKQFLRSAVFMYANQPFMPNTKYHVKMSGTYAGGMLMKEWTFTTGAAPTWPPRR